MNFAFDKNMSTETEKKKNILKSIRVFLQKGKQLLESMISVFSIMNISCSNFQWHGSGTGTGTEISVLITKSEMGGVFYLNLNTIKYLKISM